MQLKPQVCLRSPMVGWFILCQPDWAKGYPNRWYNIISGCSVRTFLGAIIIELANSVQQTVLPNVGGYWSTPWGPQQNKQAAEG